METKKCTKCGEEKSITDGDFSKRKDSKDGYLGCCKTCQKNRTKEYYENNKEEIKEQRKGYSKEYREKNRESMIKYSKEYRAINKDSVSKKSKDYYKSNKDSRKEYREKNRKKNKEYHRKYRKNNSEKIKKWKLDNKDKLDAYNKRNKIHFKEKGKTWRFDNKEKSNSTASKRRSAKRRALPQLTKNELNKIEKLYSLSKDKSKLDMFNVYHVDHVVPIQGKLPDGKRVLGAHRISNLQIMMDCDNVAKLNRITYKELSKAKEGIDYIFVPDDYHEDPWKYPEIGFDVLEA